MFAWQAIHNMRNARIVNPLQFASRSWVEWFFFFCLSFVLRCTWREIYKILCHGLWMQLHIHLLFSTKSNYAVVGGSNLEPRIKKVLREPCNFFLSVYFAFSILVKWMECHQFYFGWSCLVAQSLARLLVLARRWLFSLEFAVKRKGVRRHKSR